MKRFADIRMIAGTAALAALLAVGMAFGSARTAQAASGAPSASTASLRYTVADDGSCTVLGGDETLSGRLRIPAALDGHPVTAVAENAFRGCDGLTCVLLPDSVRSVGSGAFADCEKLEHIDLPESVTAVGTDAFPGWEHFSAAAPSAPAASPSDGGTQREADVIITYETERFYLGSGSFPQELLQTIRDTIMAGSEEEISLRGYGITTSQVTSLKAAVREAYPLEYAAAAVRTTATRSSGGTVIGLWMYPNTEMAGGLSPAKRYEKLAAAVNPVVASLRGKSDFEKILLIHDKLALESAYDTTYSRYRAYEIIIDKTGVCQAYSEAMQLYLTLLGVPCNVVPSDEMNHAWNMVRLGGNWYHVDVTWDDPVPDLPGEVRYGHFLCNDAEIAALDHSGWESDVTSSSTAYAAMPRTDSTMQCFHGGQWYWLDDEGGNDYTLKACDPSGANARTLAGHASGGVAAYHNTLLYGSGEDVAAFWLTDGQNAAVCSLTQEERDLSDYDQCRILSLSVDAQSLLRYTYRIWRYVPEKQHYTSDTAGCLAPVSLSAFLDPLEDFFAQLDALPQTVASQAQADAAQTMLTAYASLSDAQQGHISAARAARIAAVRDSLAQFAASGIAVTQQPVSASGEVGSTVSFTVKADGTGLSYQWYYKKAGENAFTAWNKKTAAAVSTPVYASWNGAQFYCRITDGSGQTVHSNTASLTVAPKITQQPVSASGEVGDTVSFTVKASGAGLSYQWYYKKAGENAFTAWNKKTAATVSTPVYKSWNGAQFRCKITDANGKTLTSSAVSLTVKTSLAVTQQPVSASGRVGDTVSFTVKASGTGLSYQWYYKKAGENAFTAWNKKTAATVSTPVYASWNGAQFCCKVTDSAGRTVASSAVSLTVTPVITQQPSGTSGRAGNKATFTLKATGTGLSYRWYYKKAGASSWTEWSSRTGSSASLTLYKSWNGAQFRCKVTDANGKTLTSDTAKLTVR